MGSLTVLWTVAVCCVFYKGGVDALRNMQLSMPEAVMVGSEAHLTCDYDLEGAQLYSIKWYRGDDEFYRYVPKESPPTKVFQQEVVNVDVSRSDNRSVTLMDMKLQSPSLYKCEVSADAPSFHTDIKVGLLNIIDAPDEGPHLIIKTKRYAIGDDVEVVCHVPSIYPRPNITWYSNGKLDKIPAVSSTRSVLSILPSVAGSTGPQAVPTAPPTRLPFSETVHIKATVPQLSVSCKAELFGVYSKESENIVLREESPPLTASVRGQNPSGDPSAAAAGSADASTNARAAAARQLRPLSLTAVLFLVSWTTQISTKPLLR